MEIAITAPVSGRVRDVFVARNVQVDAGTPLFRIEPRRRRRRQRCRRDGPHRPHGAAGGPGRRRRARSWSWPPCSASTSRPPRPSRAAGRRRRSGADALAILDAFADLCALAPERRDPDADTDETRGSREHFNTYLRSLDAEREGLPQWFNDRLLRALAHYGVAGLDPSPSTRGCVAAHLRRPATARGAAPHRGGTARGPAGVDRAARDAGSGDRVDPAALPGDRQPRPRGPLQPLRPSAHRSSAGRGLGHDEAPRRRAPRIDRRSGPSGWISSWPARCPSGRSSPRRACSPTRRRPAPSWPC